MLATISKAATDAPWLKFVAAIGGVIVQYFLPDAAQRELFCWSFGFVVLDTITGVFASVKTGRAIESARFRRMIAKIGGYLVLVFLGAAVARFIALPGNLDDFSVSAVLSMIMATEGLSIIENLHRLGLVKRLGPIERAFRGVTEAWDGTERRQG